MLLAVSAKDSMPSRTWPGANSAGAVACQRVWDKASLRTWNVLVVTAVFICHTVNETARRFNTGGPLW